MNEIFVSIITPLYNREAYVEETVASILAQTYDFWELIIVDDGSIDGSIKIVESYARQDSRIKLFKRNRLPKGACTCRNIGIMQATGKYILFLDSDDLLLTFNLEQRIQVFESHPLFDFHVFLVTRWNEQQNTKIPWCDSASGDHLSRFLQIDPVWHTSGPIWKRESLIKNELFWDPKLKVWQDLDYHVQALIKKMTYQVHFECPADVLYREHSGESISQKGYNRQQRESQFNFIRKTFPLLQKENRHHLKALGKKLEHKNFQARNFRTFLKLWWWQRVNYI